MSPDPLSLFRVSAVGTRWDRVDDPDVALGAWGQLVRCCLDGYHMGFFEYRNDIAVRGVLERVIQAAGPEPAADVAEYIAGALEFDEQLKQILTPYEVPRFAGQPWWMSRVPPFGGPEYVEEARAFRLELTEYSVD